VPAGFIRGYLNKRINDDLKSVRRNGLSVVTHFAAHVVAFD
jgi:hypothetical protein